MNTGGKGVANEGTGIERSNKQESQRTMARYSKYLAIRRQFTPASEGLDQDKFDPTNACSHTKQPESASNKERN